MLENGEEVPRGFQWLCQIEYVNTIRAQLSTFPLSTFWNQALHMSGRESFSFQKVIQVRYRNESGVDVGGLKRDFFSILIAQLLDSNLLTQYTDNVGYSPSANVLALQQGQCTQRSAAWWRRCCSKERACHPSSATCLYNTACTDASYSRYLWQANTCRQFLTG